MDPVYDLLIRCALTLVLFGISMVNTNYVPITVLKNPDLNRLILNHGSAQKLNQIKSEGEGLTKKLLLSGREVTSIERTVS